MILIDALYINNSGGLELLKYLIEYIEQNNISAYYLLDKRCENSFLNIPKNRKTVLEASFINRRRFYKKIPNSINSVLCFGNIPPTMPKKVTIYTYFHNINLLVIPRGGSLKQYLFNKLKQIFILYFKSNTDKWIVQTTYTKNALCENLKISEEYCLVLPFFRPLDNLFSLSRNRQDYIYVSNYVKEKNHENLIYAWNILYKLGYNLRLHLTLSNIPLRLDNLLKKSIENGTPIINHGFVPKEKLGKLYLQSKATVYPSFNESLGLGIIEALQYGCDVIGSNLPFIGAICKPSGVFNPYDVDSIVESIVNYETKKRNHSKLLINDNLPELIELLDKQTINE